MPERSRPLRTASAPGAPGRELSEACGSFRGEEGSPPPPRPRGLPRGLLAALLIERILGGVKLRMERPPESVERRN